MKRIIDFLSIIYFVIMIGDIDSNSIKAIVTLVLIAAIVLYNGGRIRVKNKLVIALVLFLLFASLEIIISGHSPINYVLSMLSMFSPIVLFIHYKNRENRKSILAIALVVWLIISVRVIFLSGMGLIDARRIISGRQEGVILSGGGYAIAVGSAVLAAYLFDRLLWKKQKKFLSVAFVVILSYLVFDTKSSITFLALIVGFLVSIILRATTVSSLKLSTASHKQVLGLALCVIVAVAFFALRSWVGQLIIQTLSDKNDIMSMRLVELGYQLSGINRGGVHTDDFVGRMARLESSLQLFGNNLLFGVTSKVGADYYSQLALGVGSHGEFLDVLARFGLFAGIPYLACYFISIVNERKEQHVKISFGYLFTFGLLFFFNPFVSCPANVAFLFIIPMITVNDNTTIVLNSGDISC